MNYQSPIEVIHTQMQSQIEGEIYKAVMKVGISVDKDELLKALAYDRNQYQKGYDDRDEEIVRCKNCKHYDVDFCKNREWETSPDWFCADGNARKIVKE